MTMNFKILTLSLSLLCISCGNKTEETLADKPLTEEVDTSTLSLNEENNILSEVDNSADLKIYPLGSYDKTEGKSSSFISLTDFYPWSDHPDSLVISNENLGDNTIENSHILNAKFRNRFLKNLNIKESDSVYIYNYRLDKRYTFAVKNLPVLAHITVYGAEAPISQYDYLVGFDLEKVLPMSDFRSYYDAFAFVGTENPFIIGEVKPILWEKINAKQFPTEIKSKKMAKTTITKLYSYKWTNFTYFLINEMHLVIVESSSNKIITETVFEEGESTGLAGLSFKNQKNENIPEQWTGNLFKNKPPVFFGFTYESFGCPSINFIHKAGKEIYINCDNRH